MAKKHEFRQDRPYANWASHLLPTRLQRQKMLKWSLYLLVLLALSVLQDVILCRFRVLGATTELVPCAIFLFCLLEGTEPGSVFALVCSMLYVFSGAAPGVFSIVSITGICILVNILRQTYLQKSFGTAMLCTALALLLYETSNFIAGLFLGLTIPVRIVGFLITAALTFLAAPILYPIGLSIGNIGGQSWKD